MIDQMTQQNMEHLVAAAMVAANRVGAAKQQRTFATVARDVTLGTLATGLLSGFGWGVSWVEQFAKEQRAFETRLSVIEATKFTPAQFSTGIDHLRTDLATITSKLDSTKDSISKMTERLSRLEALVDKK